MVVMDEQTKQVILRALDLLRSSGPRTARAWSGVPPVLVFTDGACEQNASKVTHGALLVDFQFSRFLYFGDDIPCSWVDKWKKSGRAQVICQAEIFPVVVAKKTWFEQLEGRAILWFVDNHSAQSSLVRSFSPVADNYELLVLNSQLDMHLQALSWYARVPSKSNPGDAPSRLECDELDRNGYTRCMPCYNLHDGVGEKGWKA